MAVDVAKLAIDLRMQLPTRSLRRRRVRQRAIRRIPRQRPPMAIALELAKVVLATVQHTRAIAEAAILRQLPALVRTDSGRRMDGAAEDLRALWEQLRAATAARQLADKAALETRIRDVAKRTSAWQLSELQRQFRAQVGVDVVFSQAGIADHLSLFVEQNVSLIKTLSSDYLTGLESTVTRGVRQGMRVEQLAKQVEDEYGSTQTQARLIARDQTLKLHGELNQLRQQSAGVDKYIWQTSDDERVRKRHEELEGQEFSWDEPPIVDPKSGRRAHPGYDYQCRCIALPVLPEVDDDTAPANDTEPEETQDETPSSAQLRAIGGVSDDQLDYLRSGMRSMDTHLAAYEGATPDEVDEIATGYRPTMNSSQTFEPIKLSSDVHPGSGKLFILEDGRHRLEAARRAGARAIAALVDGKRAIIPIPK